MGAQEGTCVLPPGAALPSLDEPCSVNVRHLLDRIGDRWSMHVVVLLRDGPLRFNELRRSIHGVSQRMLTFTLRSLERDVLVARTVVPTVPPSVSYELTALGQTLLGPLIGLVSWALANQEAVAHARRAFESRT
jgi:DNA-binding HxlR family transcriptional regulator